MLTGKLDNFMHKTLIIGIGNAFRRDDGLGSYVVDRFGEEFARLGADRACSRGEGFELMELWKPYSRVILVDAVAANGRPGELLRFDVHAQKFPKDLCVCSTHALSVGQTLELARSMKELPERCVFLGIIAQTFEAGWGLSPAVEQAVPEMVEQIKQELRG